MWLIWEGCSKEVVFEPRCERQGASQGKIWGQRIPCRGDSKSESQRKTPCLKFRQGEQQSERELHSSVIKRLVLLQTFWISVTFDLLLIYLKELLCIIVTQQKFQETYSWNDVLRDDMVGFTRDVNVFHRSLLKTLESLQQSFISSKFQQHFYLPFNQQNGH